MKRLAQICLIFVFFTISTLAFEIKVSSYNIRNYDFDTRSNTHTNKAELINILKNLKFDIIAIQEIVNFNSMSELIKESFPNYELILSKCGGQSKQKLGFIYNKNILRLINISEELSLNLTGSCHSGGRPALIANFKHIKSKETITFVAVHLKAGASPRATKLRSKQLNHLKNMIEEIREGLNEKIIIMGDFNTTSYYSEGSGHECFLNFISSSNVSDISQNLTCTAFWWGGENDGLFYPSILDHILVSNNFKIKSEGSAVHCKRSNCNPSPQDILGTSFKEVSDHCPIWSKLIF